MTLDHPEDTNRYEDLGQRSASSHLLFSANTMPFWALNPRADTVSLTAVDPCIFSSHVSMKGLHCTCPSGITMFLSENRKNDG
jgi:hypothetical protein